MNEDKIETVYRVNNEIFTAYKDAERAKRKEAKIEALRALFFSHTELGGTAEAAEAARVAFDHFDEIQKIVTGSGE